MIKIEPFLATDSLQLRALLRHQDEPFDEVSCTEKRLLNSGLAFWQHWLPCRFHILPSVYIAKEEGIILGMVAVNSTGKSNSCWQINQLIIHPEHRGRGIAQKLLQYVFALFGSQGVSHFISEVFCGNAAALSLLGGLGFRRAARITYYQMPSGLQNAEGIEIETNNSFVVADLQYRKSLLQLYQDSLPADLRLIFAYKEDDFCLPSLPLSMNKSTILNSLAKQKSCIWINEDSERQVLTAAIKISSHHEEDFHIEFIIHPGWRHLNEAAVKFATNLISTLALKGKILAKTYDYQSGLAEALEECGWQKKEEFLLMTREHWLRVKKRRSIKLEGGVGLPSIAKPAINLPRLQNK